MKNLQYFPFERNRYYYGKLLTEQDFNSEQRYMNDKRRMGNRFLHGMGVVCGLKVVEIDEKSISLEPGFALDGVGREIVVERPKVMRLEQMNGFETITEQGNRDFVYLCIEYEEKEAVPSHNVAAGTSIQTGEAEYDKWQEGYRLYLTDRPLQEQGDTLETLFTKTEVLYEDAGICIFQKMPRFVKSGEEFCIKIRVENRGSAKECRLVFKETLCCAAYQGESVLNFDETMRFEKRDSVQEFEFLLKAFPVEMGQIEFSIGTEEFSLTWGQKKCQIEKERTFKVEVENKEAGFVLAKRHFEESMNRILQNTYPEGIYLAKIYLIQTGSVYIIDSVESMPFSQYVYHPLLAMELLKELYEKQMKEGIQERSGLFLNGNSRNQSGKHQAEGFVDLELGVGGKRGQRFFSHEIAHGLGLGKVAIQLSLMGEREMLFGSSEIFEDVSPKAELAAKADITRGSFVIGMRLLEPTGQQSVTIHWSAVLLEEEKESMDEPSLTIRPDKLELHIRESRYLETVVKNIPGATILWEVKSPGGGSISRDGMYTAPNQAGVYEIQAWCQELPSIKASLYVIVRD